ncbi:MFS transporter [Congregibacter brevis]|uniref:MFS transporter n=1 Tax=Congregibacter brevis TaxID=3081201 RepID=A0ABZ0ICX5_9GAMM|nr:MFS transporter [Congregibacter sp. IMCC45268]
MIDKAFVRLTLIKSDEQRAVGVSFLIVFLLMASYFVLRPVRDAMASDWTDAEVSLLWNLQFFLSAALVALYSLCISRLPFRWVVPTVYGGFATSFVLFFYVTPLLADPTWVEKGFYLWVAAFGLFNLSVFWSFMADTFRREQGQRLFAIIGSGASAGAILGPGIPTLFAGSLGLDKLMLIAALGLLLVVPLIVYVRRLKLTQLGNVDAEVDFAEHRISGDWWSGFRDVLSKPYLLAIAAFIVLYVFVGSFVYFEQKNLLAAYSRPERAQILGGIDWIVNSLTFLFAFLLTGRLVQRLGMATTLALVPVAVMLGLLVLAAAPSIVVLLALQATRRVGNYAVTRPARELLFTQVTTEERFKAKPVIDVVVYRGGDAISGSLFALLTEGVGLGLAAVAIVGACIAAVWTVTGVFLGRLFDNVAFRQTSQTRSAELQMNASFDPPTSNSVTPLSH